MWMRTGIIAAILLFCIAQIAATGEVMKVRNAIGCLAILAGSLWSQAAQAQDAPPPSPELAGGDWAAVPQLEEPPCGRPGRTWARAELLWWWIQGMALPPLVTTGSADAQGGVLGAPGTAILFGDDWVNHDVRWGGRFTLGAWYDDQALAGLEVGFLVLESQASPFAVSGNGSTVITRPFFNAATGQQDAELVSFPGVVSGAVAAIPRSGNLYGVNLDLRQNISCDNRWRVDGLVGYRFLRYDESLTIYEDLTALEDNQDVEPGSHIQIFDSFAVRNEFHGFDLGVVAEARRGPRSVELVAKVALGKIYRIIDIDGGTLTTVPGGGQTANEGGLLALASNIGRYHSDEFSVLPEVGINFGWQVRENLYLRFGYTALWLINAVRAAEQVDVAVNPGLLPPVTNANPPRPAFALRESDLWVQGISLGAEFRY